MTGQVKEQVLTRFGELGVEVVDGCVRFAPRLLPRSELLDVPSKASFRGVDGETTWVDLAPGSLAFSYCQVPVTYRLGEVPGVELEHADGRMVHVEGSRLDRAQSTALFRRSVYRRLAVTVVADSLF